MDIKYINDKLEVLSALQLRYLQYWLAFRIKTIWSHQICLKCCFFSLSKIDVLDLNVIWYFFGKFKPITFIWFHFFGFPLMPHRFDVFYIILFSDFRKSNSTPDRTWPVPPPTLHTLPSHSPSLQPSSVTTCWGSPPPSQWYATEGRHPQHSIHRVTTTTPLLLSHYVPLILSSSTFF